MTGNAAQIKMGNPTQGPASNSCGWVAIHNALTHFGQPVPVAVMVQHFEKSGGLMTALNSAVNPLAMADYLKSKGYKNETKWFPDSMDDLIRNSASQAGILIYINQLDKDGINSHYVFTHYDADSEKFTLYNSNWNYINAHSTSSIDYDMKNRGFVRMGVITLDEK